MKKNWLIIMTLLAAAARGQDFRFSCQTAAPATDGIHRIRITPELRAICSSDLHDCRLYDDQGKEQPFVLRETMPLGGVQTTALKIVGNKQRGKTSEIILLNQDKRTIDNLVLELNNSDAHKFCAIEGSDDQAQWYSISARQELFAESQQQASATRRLLLPATKYQYIRIVTDDSASGPFKINSAATANLTSTGSDFDSFDVKVAGTKKTGNHLSAGRLEFDGKVIHKLKFNVHAPAHFKRPVVLFVTRSNTYRKQVTYTREVIAEGILASGSANEFNFDGLKLSGLEYEIEDGDNQALQFDVTGFQRQTYLLSDLRKGINYTLKCGNTALHVPRYDLNDFVQADVGMYPLLKVSAPAPLGQHSIKASVSRPFYETQMFMWTCIIAAALGLVFFSRSLMRDMNRNA